MLSDEELLQELKQRFRENKKSLEETRLLLKQLEVVNKKLEESEALKSHFLSNIRNEINNPLSAILGLAKNLTMTEFPSHQLVQELGGSIFYEASNLNFQLLNIFNAAELEAGETRGIFSNVNLENLIQGLMGDFEQHWKLKKQTIEFHNGDSFDNHKVTFFRTDPEKIYIILMNLLSNAIEYSPETAYIKLRLWKEPERVLFSIQDQGPGIRVQNPNDIFDRFRQLDSGPTKRHRGHGLGLSVVRALSDLLHGEINYVSHNGNGSTFTLSLPEASAESTTEAFSSEGNELVFTGEELF